MLRRSLTPLRRILSHPLPSTPSPQPYSSFTSFTQHKLNLNSPIRNFLPTPYSTSQSFLPHNRLSQGYSSFRFRSYHGGKRSPARVILHVSEGIQEILADYVHHEMTRTWISICLRLFLITLVKDAFIYGLIGEPSQEKVSG